ncbi:MAG: prolipoprotein diacylglyceryl transferase, partial [Sedimentisphaerales bacterium]|nr:prolipoprotein diacylglyceryl transferase [Sedimentisphaerales bacterium]
EFKANPAAADELTEELVTPLRQGEYPMHKIHPTQLYSSLNGLVLCLILQWRFKLRNNRGVVFSLMLILYGMARFMIEGVRADSPLEFTGLTISQNLSLLSIIGGMVMFGVFKKYPQAAVEQAETGAVNGKGKC